MDLFNLFKKESTEVVEQPKEIIEQKIDFSEPTPHPSSLIIAPNYPVIETYYDGEKTVGELGILNKSIPNYEALRIRGYEADLKLGVVKIVTGAYYKWVVGRGLKLQCEPNKTVLKYEGVNISQERYNEIQQQIEAYFMQFANSKKASYKEDLDLHDLGLEAFKTSFAGGDVLIVCRFENKKLNVQAIDGAHINGTAEDVDIPEGYTVTNGIVLDKRGRHYGYIVDVTTDGNETKKELILSVGKASNKRMAWLIYGDKTRIDSSRGIPEFTATLETANKFDRYIEASVKKAEEAANVIYTIEHDHTSTGEDPLAEQKAIKDGHSLSEKERINMANGVVSNVNKSVNGTAYNLPIGAKFRNFVSNSELSFPEFFKSILSYVCSQVNMPPEVAMQSFNSNYSASRAAINSWGHTVNTRREKFSKEFYIPIYKLWLELMVLTDKIAIEELKQAIIKDNEYIVDAFSKCRFIGVNMPHIDPLKEVKAIRAMLGDENTPLTTFEKACEDLGNGEFTDNLTKYSEERKQIEKLIPTENETTSEANQSV